MGFVIKEEERKIQPISQAVHQGVCYGFYDLGTRYIEEFAKRVHQCLLIWEVPKERIDIEREGQKLNLPRVISKTYTASLNEKSNLRKDLVSWRGRDFTAEELKVFEMTALLGVNCMLQVIHKTKNNKTYATLSSILPLYQGMNKLEPENPVRYFSFQDHTDIPEDTPTWIKDIIERSEEWAAQNSYEPAATLDNEDVPF